MTNKVNRDQRGDAYVKAIKTFLRMANSNKPTLDEQIETVDFLLLNMPVQEEWIQRLLRIFGFDRLSSLGLPALQFEDTTPYKYVN